MKKVLLSVFLMMFPIFSCLAQSGYIHGNGDPRTMTPTPNCGASRFFIDDSTGNLYIASQGSPCVWTVGGSGGAVASVNGQTGAVVLSATNVGASPSNFGSYIAFGDSITFAFELNSRTGGYAFLIANALGVQVNDQGVSGATSQTIDPVIFANPIFSSSPVRPLVSYMIGTNNVTAGNGSQFTNAYQANIAAQYAFLALPTSQKTLGTSASVTYNGSWGVGQFTVGKKTTTVGDTATLTLTGSTLFIGLLSNSTNAATISLTVDGVAQTAPVVNVGPPGVNQTALTTITGLSNTAHTVVLAVTGAGTLELDWAAGITSTSANNTWPILLAMGIIDRNPTDSVTPVYTAIQQSVVSQLQANGLTNINFVPTTGLIAIPGDYNDSLHPIGHGHYLISKAALTALNTLIPNPVQIPPFVNVPAGDNAVGPSSIGMGYAALTINSGNGNAAFGYNAMPANTTGNTNVGIGAQALLFNTTGNSNTAVGENTLTVNTSGSFNVAVGFQSLMANATTSQNTAVGVNALKSTTVGNNVALGFEAFQNLTTGAGNTALGFEAGLTATTANATTVSGTQTYVGSNAGASTPSATVLTGSGAFGANALVGANGAYEIGTGTCAIANMLCFNGVPTAGANHGLATLVAGTVTVSTALAVAISSTRGYQLTPCVPGGTQGFLSVGTVTAGTSFIINSSNAADTGQVCWTIY